MIKFDERANKAVEMLQQSGFEAFFVGGCVRDGIMGKKLHDFDITTNALPKQICDVFKGHETIEVGIEFGTVVVIVDGLSLEITTYRKESEYLDNRHPSMLTFSTSLDTDLSRRDFTINALAYNKQCGIVDHFGGLDDIKNKKLGVLATLMSVLKKMLCEFCEHFALHRFWALKLIMKPKMQCKRTENF